MTPERPHDPVLLRHAAERALELGRTVAGTTGPNPPVGCVIVQDGGIVGEGATRPVGGPHAEVVALAAAGERSRGATAVVTLEPCSHTGRTGPCTEALRAAGIVRVVHLLSDPDPRAAGGAQRLREMGIRVDRGLDGAPELTAAAADDLRGFLATVRAGRPHVTLKLAQRMDGTTEPVPGNYLTGPVARERVHALRAQVDAVLVGGRTVRVDDPRLDVRHVVAQRQPRPVVVTSRGDLPTTAQVLDRGALVVVGPETTAATVERLTSAGAEVVQAPADAAVADGRLDAAAALRLLPEHRILTVLAEPGIALAAALLDADVVDVVELHVAGGALTGASEPVPALRLAAGRFHPAERASAGDDLVLRLARSVDLAEVA